MKIRKISNRILAYTLTLAILLSSLVFGAVSVTAEDTEIDVWDGTTATGFAGGDGSAATPYLIETAEQLRYLLENYTKTGESKDKFFKITKDIYLNDISNVNDPVDLWGKQNWLAGYGETVPVPANNVNLFEGTLDGDGHTIYGLYVNGVAYAGLFPAVSSYATIKNLSLEKVFITGGSGSAGAIAGWAEYTSWQSATQITNCSVVDATIGQAANIEFVGGLVGRIDTTTVTVTNCSAYGLTLSQDTGRGIAGGLIGFAQTDGTLKINNSFSVGYFATCSQITKAICTNVYTTADIPEGYTNGGVTKLNTDQMKGDAAKENMAGFDFKYTWKTVTNGYPVFSGIKFWDGTTATEYAGGKGTYQEPYLIENGAQLLKMAKESTAKTSDASTVKNTYFKITKDIYLNPVTNEDMVAPTVESWNAKGFRIWDGGYRWSQSTGFCGTIDGDGHTVYGLYVESGCYSGFLANVVGNATVNNLHFKNAFVRGASNGCSPAVIIGAVNGNSTVRSTATVTNCTVDNGYVFSDHTGSWRNGIIVGGGFNEGQITVSNCAVTNSRGAITNTSTEKRTAAFIGNTNYTKTHLIENCFTDSSMHPVTDATTEANYKVIHDNKIYKNVYTSATQPSYDTNGDITYLTEEQMQGEAARENMVGFDFDFLWKTVENGYPVLRPMDERISAWDGGIATSLKGEGTKANPYKISNGAELYYAIVTYSNADVTVAPTEQKYFEITSDINLANKQWYVPGLTAWLDNAAYNNIGFTGVIYGNGHTIYNFNSNAASTAAGLIPVATQGTQIYDLHLVGGTLPRYNWRSYALGGFIGLAKGAAGSAPIIIDGCSVKNFDIAAVHGGGGFIGYSFSQSYNIKDSYVVNSTIVADEDKVTAGTANASAFVGFIDGSEINNSFAIENCYTDNLSAESAQKKESFAAAVSYKNVYTTNEAYDGSVEGLTKLDDAQMKAKLAGFNYNQVWQTVENGYSVHLDYAVQKEIFSGTEAASYAGGKGTEDDPFLISNADQLYKLANATREETLGKFYKLTNDITISRVYDGWTNDNLYTWAVKKAYLEGFTYASSFAGTLDGAGYTVSGIYYNNEITDNGDYAYGLIPFATANAVVKDITVSDINATVTGNGAAVGGVVGAAHVTPEDAENPFNFIQFVGVNVKNCSANAAYTGDIVGRATHGIKFEICNADSIIGNYTDNIFMNGCNEALTLGDNVVIYNALNADSKALEVIRAKLIGTTDAYITDINATYGFDIADLVSAYRNIVAAAEDEYELVWSQDFNNNTMDYSVWSQNTTMSRKTNLVYGDNATVNGGSLKLNNKDTGEVDENGNKIYSVSYGLSTVDTMSFKYGRLEMRAKIPFGAGAFPSLWLTSRNALGNGVSPYGYDNEIDIFEVFGKSTSQDRMITCMHKWYVDENGNRIKDAEGNSIECSNGTGVFSGNGSKIDEADRSHIVTEAGKTAWHTIVFEWTEDTMTFTVDGESYDIKLSQLGDFDLTDYDTDSEGLFNQFMYLRLNNHMYTVGGSTYVYGGSESDIDPNKLTYEIDYIKLYQKDNGEINLK